MDGKVLYDITVNSLSGVNLDLGDITKYKTDCNSYDENDIFWQIVFYNKTNKSRIHEIKYNTFFFDNEIEMNELKTKLEKYNIALKKSFEKEIENFSNYAKSEIKNFCSVGENLGIINCEIYKRNKFLEGLGYENLNDLSNEHINKEIEEIKAFESIEYEEYEDDIFPREEEEGPYGGAFSSWDDYYRYRGAL